jgi:hypothetical protein
MPDDAESCYLLGGFWSGRRDLNPRPPVPQTGALTGLRHAPTDKTTIISAHQGRNDIREMPATIYLPSSARALDYFRSRSLPAEINRPAFGPGCFQIAFKFDMIGQKIARARDVIRLRQGG